MAKTLLVLTICLLGTAVRAQHQQQIDPSYLQQYYAQVAQAAGAQSAAEATPIFEQSTSADQPQVQYLSGQQAQQIRQKDAVAQQVRAQQQQQYVAPSVRQYLQQPQHQPQALPQPRPQPQAQPQTHYYAQPQQQIHYRPAPAPIQKQTVAVVAPPRPRAQAQHYQPQPQQHRPQQHEEQHPGLNREEEESYEQNPSYQFGFDVKDDEFTNYQNRKESRDGNVIKGSYSVVDSDGFIRTVTYTADPKEGFKAEVVREPTDIVVKVPTPAPPQASHPHLQSAPQRSQHQQPQSAPQYYQPQHQQQQPQQIHLQPQQQYRVVPQKHHAQPAAPQPQYQYE